MAFLLGLFVGVVLIAAVVAVAQMMVVAMLVDETVVALLVPWNYYQREYRLARKVPQM